MDAFEQRRAASEKARAASEKVRAGGGGGDGGATTAAVVDEYDGALNEAQMTEARRVFLLIAGEDQMLHKHELIAIQGGVWTLPVHHSTVRRADTAVL